MAKVARIFRKGVYKWVPINRASTILTFFWCSALVSSACAFAARLLNAATFPTKKWHSQHSLSSSDSYKTQNNSYIKQLPYSLNSLPRASCYERVINSVFKLIRSIQRTLRSTKTKLVIWNRLQETTFCLYSNMSHRKIDGVKLLQLHSSFKNNKNKLTTQLSAKLKQKTQINTNVALTSMSNRSLFFKQKTAVRCTNLLPITNLKKI